MEPQLADNRAAKRKQLSEGMSHMRDHVVVEGEAPAYGVPAEFQPVRKPRTEASANPEKRTDPFQFGSRFLEEGDDIFAYNAWDHVETDDTYKEFVLEQFQKQRENPVNEADKSTYVLAFANSILHVPLQADIKSQRNTMTIRNGSGINSIPIIPPISSRTENGYTKNFLSSLPSLKPILLLP